MKNMEKGYLIGVDGGATKSSASLADVSGKIIAERRGRALNYHTVGQKQAEKSLNELLRPFFKKYKKIRTVVIGFAGLDTPRDLRVYKKITKRVLPAKTKSFLFNDAQIALEAVCEDRNLPRILIISGTGSSVYGEFKNRQAKAIGWDFLAGDEGSAYWMGMEAIKKAVQSWDGRRKKTILEKLVLEKSRSKDMPRFLSKLYQSWHRKPGDFKKHIASFALLFHRSRKDSAAKEIIGEASDELVLGVTAVINKLGVKEKPFCAGFIGSGFKNPGLLPSLTGKIKKAHPKVRFVYNVNPLQGAINLAMKLNL